MVIGEAALQETSGAFALLLRVVTPPVSASVIALGALAILPVVILYAFARKNLFRAMENFHL